ncbi:hypothetical protein SCH4B_1688 [Ruegeria sp. TrichCH4B]|nr:hypothetical protein SCH4B_1688 [Ruegeria sp. TrichCH4B]
MAYGITLQNDLGETITEYEDVLFEMDSGVTRRLPTLPYAPEFDKHLFYNWATSWGSNPKVPRFEQIAKGTKWITTGRSQDLYKIHRVLTGNDDWPLNTFPFVKMPTEGIWGMLGVPFRYPSNGPRVMMWAVGTNATGLPFKMAGDNLPATLSGNYGMQIRKPSGAVAFDSRAKMISLAGHFYMSQSDMVAVLENGATRTYNISSPAPGSFVCAPHYTSFLYTGSGAAWVPRLRQTDDTTFLLDRIAIAELRPGLVPDVGYAGAFFHDTTVMVARNI